MVERIVREKTGAEATFSHYRFRVFRHFPALTLVLEDVVLRDPGYPIYGQELLRIDRLEVRFGFWPLLRRELEVRALSLQGGGALLFKNGDGSYSNLDFLKGDTTRQAQTEPKEPPRFSIDRIELEDFSFRYVDSLRLKDYHVELRDTRIDLEPGEARMPIRLRGDWFFHGLTFKFPNGPFLGNEEGEVDWRLEWDKDQQRLTIGPSTLEVEGETVALSGYLALGRPARLKLVIEHPGIMLDTGRRLVSDNIRRGLGRFAIDRPVEVRVLVEGPLIPGKPVPTDVYFAVEEAGVQVDRIPLTQTSFSGHFYNCDRDGPVDPHSGCLQLDTFSARIYEAIPIRGSALMQDLVDPIFQVNAGVAMPLADLAPVLPPGKVALQDGRFDLNFHFAGRVSADPEQKPVLQGRLELTDGALRYLPTDLPVSDLNAVLSFDEEDLLLHDFHSLLGEERFDLQGEFCDLLPFLLYHDRQVQANLEVRTGRLNVDHFLPPPGQASPARRPAARSSSAGPNRIAATLERLLDRFNARLNIQADGLVVRGYSATDVTLKSRFLSRCPETDAGGCLLLDTLSAKVYGDIPFGASLQLTDFDHPYLRLNLELAGPLTSFNALLPPEQIRLNGGDLDLQLHYAGLLDAYFGMGEGAREAAFEGRVALHGASADYQDGKYRLRDAAAELQFNEDYLQLSNVGLEVNGSRVELDGRVAGFIPFLFTETGDLQAGLSIRSPRLDFNAFPLKKSGLQKEKRERKERTSPADSSLIARKLARVAEHLEAELEVQAGQLIFHEFEAEAVDLHGAYSLSCAPGQPPLGCVRVDTFNALLFGNAPLQASFTVENLNDPLFQIEAWVDMPLADLNSLFSPEQLRFHDGAIDLQLRYRGRPHDHFDSENLLVKADLDGEVVLDGVDLSYVSKGYRLSELNGRVRFDQRDLVIPRLKLKLNDNPLSASGTFRYLIPFLFSPSNKLEATFEVHAPEFSFDRFSAPAKHQPTGDEEKPAPATPLNQTVNAVLDSLLVNFQLSVDRLLYRNFTGQDMYADVHLSKDELAIREARMNAGGGRFDLEGSISGLARNQPLIDLEASFREADISVLFRSFDNFGQKGLSHENLDGVLDAALWFKAQANDNYDILPETIEGTFTLSIRDGVLQDFPLFTKMDNYFIKYRDLDSVRFGNLEHFFRLEDQVMHIDKFELASSLLSFKVNGSYDLQKKGRTNLLFEIPLANLFERDVSREALNKYFERGQGPSLLMRIIPKEDGALGVRPVLVRKKQERKGKQ